MGLNTQTTASLNRKTDKQTNDRQKDICINKKKDRQADGQAAKQTKS